MARKPTTGKNASALSVVLVLAALAVLAGCDQDPPILMPEGPAPTPPVSPPPVSPPPEASDVDRALREFEAALSQQAWEALLQAAKDHPATPEGKVVLSVQRYLQAGLDRDLPDTMPRTDTRDQPQVRFSQASAQQVQEMHLLRGCPPDLVWRLLAAMTRSEFDRAVPWYACQIGSGLSAGRYEQLKKDLQDLTAGRPDLRDVLGNAPLRWQGDKDLPSRGGPPWP